MVTTEESSPISSQPDNHLSVADSPLKQVILPDIHGQVRDVLDSIATQNEEPQNSTKSFRRSFELPKRVTPEKQQEIARNDLLLQINSVGELLPETHVFAQTCKKIADRLNVPIYAVDTEDQGFAFFDPGAKSVALGKGVFTLLSQNGLNISEDHIAAIIAHELIHAKREEKENPTTKKQKRESSLKYSVAGHNQEHEADREGMMLLSEWGYNPKAMVDILVSLSNLKDSEASLSHPGDLDRVNHLKDVLFDDSHPVANTDKEYTPVQQELKDWVVSPSDEVYKQTDEFLQLNSNELHQRLLSANSSTDFLILSKLYKNTLTTERANALAQMPELDEVVRKTLVLRAFITNQIIWDGKLQDNPFSDNLYDVLYSSYNNRTEGLTVDQDNSNLPEPRFMSARSFRQKHTADTQYIVDHGNEITNRFQNSIKGMDEAFQEVLAKITDAFNPAADEIIAALNISNTDIQEALKQDNLEQLAEAISNYEETSSDDETLDRLEKYIQYRHMASYLKDVFEGTTPMDSRLISTVFHERDRKAQAQSLRDSVEENRKNGIAPISDKAINDYLENHTVDMETNWQDYLKGLHESIAHKAIDTIQLPQDALDHLGELICQETNIDIGNKHVIARLLTEPMDEYHSISKQMSDKLQLLQGIPKEGLLRLAQLYPDIVNVGIGRLSSERTLHTSFENSLIDSNLGKGFSSYIDPLHDSELAGYSNEIIANEILKRAYKGEQEFVLLNEYGKDPLSVDEFDLTLAEWKVLTDLTPHAHEYFRAKALREYIDNVKAGIEPDELTKDGVEDIEVISPYRDVDFFPEQIHVSKDDLMLLIKHSPWSNESTQKYLQSYISNELNGDLSKIPKIEQNEKLHSVIELAEEFIHFSEANPVNMNSEYNRKHIGNINSIRRKVVAAYSTIIINELQTPEEQQKVGLPSERYDELQKQALPTIVTTSVEKGIIRSLADLYDPYVLTFKNESILDVIHGYILDRDSTQLDELISQTKSFDKENKEGFTFTESLELLKYLPNLTEDEVTELISRNIFSSNKKAIPDRGLVYLGLVKDEIHPVLVKKILEQEKEHAVDFINSHFHASYAKNRLLASLVLGAEGELRNQLQRAYLNTIDSSFDPDHKYEYMHPDNEYARTTARYDLDEGYKFNGQDVAPEQLQAINNEEYDDIALRRHPFATVAFNLEELDFNSKDDFRKAFPSDSLYGEIGENNRYYKRGNVEQKLLAEVLKDVQDELVNQQTDFQNRVELLTQSCPVKTVVRDIHLERMIRSELSSLQTNPVETINHCENLLELFASSEFTESYAVKLLEARIKLDPEVVSQADAAVDFIVKYLPSASLKRNYYLSKVEAACSLTPQQAEKMRNLRLTEELESETGEGYYQMSILNHLGNNIDRSEKRQVVLWLMQMQSDKPNTVTFLEDKWKGHLDNIPKMFLDLTPDERTVIMKRFLLGSQGVIDLAQAELYDLDQAKEDRSLFLNRIAEAMIPDNTQGAQLFRRIFVSVLETAEPVKSSQIISHLVDKFVEATKNNKTFTPAEALSTALCDFGIVGKKVAQSLAGMSWVPSDFQEALMSSQESADTVPKLALVEIARQNHLLDENSPVQIKSFDQLLGAASNKQACLVTVKINDPKIADELGVAVGSEVQIVGKFKRPSAQKVENLDHDLNVLTKIITVLNEEGYGGQLPPNFEQQIGSAIRRELNFAAEVDFNHALKEDLQSRSNYKGYSISIPTIISANNDLVLETRAEGTSLRSVIDKGEVSSSELKEIKTVVLRELMMQLLITGNIDADLHPGNIFVDANTKKITLIDLGMNIQFDKKRITDISKLLSSMALGNTTTALSTLTSLGWQVPADAIQLLPLNIKNRAMNGLRNFIGEKIGIKTESKQEQHATPVMKEVMMHNLKQLLDASRKSATPPPEDVALLIFSASKLEPYLESATFNDVASILTEVVGVSIQRRLSSLFKN